MAFRVLTVFLATFLVAAAAESKRRTAKHRLCLCGDHAIGVQVVDDKESSSVSCNEQCMAISNKDVTWSDQRRHKRTLLEQSHAQQVCRTMFKSHPRFVIRNITVAFRNRGKSSNSDGSDWCAEVSWKPFTDPPERWSGYCVSYSAGAGRVINSSLYPQNTTSIEITPGFEKQHMLLSVVVVPTDVQNKDEKELVLMQRYTRGTSRQPGEDEEPTILLQAEIESSGQFRNTLTTTFVSNFRVCVEEPEVRDLEPARAFDSCRRPEGSWALGMRMIHGDLSVFFSAGVDPTLVFTTTTKRSNRTPVILCISAGVVVGLGVCLLVYFFRHKKDNIPLPPDFKYHAFIIYNGEDTPWMKNKLLPFLEEKHHLTCCVHYRDFVLGKPFRDNMADSVYTSYKVIALFSNNFVNSNYCNYELDIALGRLVERRDNSLVVIRIDGADWAHLPEELKRRSCIDYHDSQARHLWRRRLLKFLDIQDESRTESVSDEQSNEINNGNDYPVDGNGKSSKIRFNRLESTVSNVSETSYL